MRVQALKDLQAKNGAQAIEIKAGQIVTLPDDKALLAKGLVEPELDPAVLPQMPLKDFGKSGLLLKIDSRVLGEIYFVSDDRAIRALPEGATYYTAKKIFDNATITGPKPKQKQPERPGR